MRTVGTDLLKIENYIIKLAGQYSEHSGTGSIEIKLVKQLLDPYSRTVHSFKLLKTGVRSYTVVAESGWGYSV